jgi:hypothetical protein
VVWTRRRIRDWQRTGIRPPVAVWTTAQTRLFLKFIAGHRLYAAYHLTALHGLRRGEACGLRWADLDLDAGLAYISRQLQHVAGKLTECLPKTASSSRVVTLAAVTIAALRAHRHTQQQDAQARGVALSEYVFTGPDGGPLSPDYLTRCFGQLVCAARLPPVRLLSRSGARYRDCSRPVSPDRSPNPPYQSLGNGLSTVAAVRRGSQVARGMGSCCPGRRSGRPSRFRSGRTQSRPPRCATSRRGW